MSQVRDVLPKIQELEKDHEQASEWHDRVEQLGRRWLADGQLTPEDTEALGTALAQLSQLYTHHIALEDQSVFPLAAAVLPSKERANIGIEMAKRRGLDPQRAQKHLSKLGNIEG